MKTTREFRQRQSREAIALKHLVRRMVLASASSDGLCSAVGVGKEVIPDVEVFGVLGFAARPRVGGGAEVVVVHVGAEPSHPVVVATLDEDIFELEPDERAFYNSLAAVHVTSDGKVEVADRSGGEAVALATKADLEAVITWLKRHTHSGVSTGLGTSGPPGAPAGVDGTSSPTNPAGTSVLKGQ